MDVTNVLARAGDPAGAQHIERDSLGELGVPAAAYYGIHTARALDNLPISGVPIGTLHDLIRAYALVKKAAAHANRDLDLLTEKKARAIVAACDEIAAGQLHDQFVVDVMQGGAGTSTHTRVRSVRSAPDSST